MFVFRQHSMQVLMLQSFVQRTHCWDDAETRCTHFRTTGLVGQYSVIYTKLKSRPLMLEHNFYSLCPFQNTLSLYLLFSFVLTHFEIAISLINSSFENKHLWCYQIIIQNITSLLLILSKFTLMWINIIL
jgi:hypothetical protein